MTHMTTSELDAGLMGLRSGPPRDGRVVLVVRRPSPNEREVLQEAELDPEIGLVGDGWHTRGSTSTVDGLAHPQRQLTIMDSRVIALVAGTFDRWPLAGDQLYADLDLGEDVLPVGTRLDVGSATVEISPEPHLGCRKFVERFGSEAMRWVNSPEGLRLRLRGVNAVVLAAGAVRVGDRVVPA